MKMVMDHNMLMATMPPDTRTPLGGGPRILVIGCGGGGNNTVSRLNGLGVEGATTIALNTDKQHLDIIESDMKVLIGKQITWGLGAGGNPAMGRRCAEMSRHSLENIMRGANLVFITAGLGGGTGTGSAPVVAEVAKEEGATVVGIVSTPFKMERNRIRIAEKGMNALRQRCDSLLVLDNNKLLQLAPDQPVKETFLMLDNLIAGFVKGVTETITIPSLINLDYADIRTVMSQRSGVSVMLYGEGSIYTPEDIINDALKNPLIDINYKGAKGALIHITGGEDLSLSLVNEMVRGMTKTIAKDAPVIMGARIDPDLKGNIRVMSILTGVSQKISMGGDEGGGTKPPGRKKKRAAPVRGREKKNKAAPAPPRPGPLDEIPWV